MSRFDGDMKAAGPGAIARDELVAALGRLPTVGADRYGAMAHFLSGDEGWRDAGSALGGTFAPLGPRGSRLTPGEDK